MLVALYLVIFFIVSTHLRLLAPLDYNFFGKHLYPCRCKFTESNQHKMFLNSLEYPATNFRDSNITTNGAISWNIHRRSKHVHEIHLVQLCFSQKHIEIRVAIFEPIPNWWTKYLRLQCMYVMYVCTFVYECIAIESMHFCLFLIRILLLYLHLPRVTIFYRIVKYCLVS